MKKEIKRLTCQTATARLIMTVYESSDGKRYVAEYKAEQAGSTAGAAPAPMKETDTGQFRGADLETVIAECRAQIEKHHGPILRST